jgi:hypothetical protein
MVSSVLRQDLPVKTFPCGRHGSQSEAIQTERRTECVLDCFEAMLLARTAWAASLCSLLSASRRRRHHQFAGR